MTGAVPPAGDDRASVVGRLSAGGKPIAPVHIPDEGVADTPHVGVRPAQRGAEGRYRILGEIARGGVGIVLRGRDVDLGRDVAMKVLRDEYADREDVVQRFIEEAQIGGQLQHPGIVPVFELGLRADGRPYFTMRLIKGRTLAALLAERGDSGEARRPLVTAFEAICQTMAYAHAHRVVHRDLKPANVMIGAFGEVQVVDWGLAKVMGRETPADAALAARTAAGERATIVETVRSGSTASQSMTGSVMGTLGYMSPEQARGEVEQIDQRSDVFGLGAILCEILTGSPPYEGKGIELLRAARDGEMGPALARLRACGADPDLVALAERCLAKSPEDRPPHAGAVAQAVGAHLHSVEDRARAAELAAVEAGARVGTERRRRRLATALAVVAGVSVAASAGLWIWAIRADADQRSRAASAVDAALAETARLRGAAADSGDPDLWERVLDSARAAAAKARTGDTALATRTAQAVAEAETETARARDHAAAQRRDAALSADLTELRLRSWDADESALDAGYRRAFHDWGADVDPETVSAAAEDALRGIRDDGLREAASEALEDWAGLRQASVVAHAGLLRLSLACESDARRNLLRDARTVEDVRAAAAALDVTTASASAMLRVADALGERKDVPGAISLCREVVTRCPRDTWGHATLARWLDLATPRDLTGTVDELSAAVALRPSSAELWARLAESLSEVGRNDSAFRAAGRAVGLDPANGRARTLQGRLRYMRGDMDGARADFEGAIAAEPRYATSYIVLANQHLQLGRVADAVRVLESATRLEPDGVFAARTLGDVWDRAGRPAEALARYRSGVARYGQQPLVHADLGWQLGVRLARFDEGLESLDHALALDPDCDDARLARALVRFQRRDSAGARRDLDIVATHGTRIRWVALVQAGFAACSGDRDGARGFARGATLGAGIALLEIPRESAATMVACGSVDEAIAWFESLPQFRTTTSGARERLPADYCDALSTLYIHKGWYGPAAESAERAVHAAGRMGAPAWQRARLASHAERTRRIGAVADRLDAVLAGEEADAADLAALGVAAAAQGRHAAAVRLFDRALDADPTLGADPWRSVRLAAASSAARVADGTSADAADLDDGGRASHRRRAIRWIREEAAAWRSRVADDPSLALAAIDALKLLAWDANLVSVRYAPRVALLDSEERDACESAWKFVERVLTEAGWIASGER